MFIYYQLCKVTCVCEFYFFYLCKERGKRNKLNQRLMTLKKMLNRTVFTFIFLYPNTQRTITYKVFKLAKYILEVIVSLFNIKM